MPETKQIIDTRTYSASETVIGPLPVTKVLQRASLEVDRTGFMDETAQLMVVSEYSLDDGKTWRFWCGFSAKGGITTVPWSAIYPSAVPPHNSLLRVSVKTNGKAIKQDLKLVEVT